MIDDAVGGKGALEHGRGARATLAVDHDACPTEVGGVRGVDGTRGVFAHAGRRMIRGNNLTQVGPHGLAQKRLSAREDIGAVWEGGVVVYPCGRGERDGH